MSVRITIDLKELYKRLPPQCRKIMEQYIREKVAEALAKQLLGGEGRDAEGS